MDRGEETPAATAELLVRLIRETAGRAESRQSGPTFTTELTPFPVPGLAKTHSRAALEAPRQGARTKGQAILACENGGEQRRARNRVMKVWQSSLKDQFQDSLN